MRINPDDVCSIMRNKKLFIITFIDTIFFRKYFLPFILVYYDVIDIFNVYITKNMFPLRLSLQSFFSSEAAATLASTAFVAAAFTLVPEDTLYVNWCLLSSTISSICHCTTFVLLLFICIVVHLCAMYISIIIHP